MQLLQYDDVSIAEAAPLVPPSVGALDEAAAMLRALANPARLAIVCSLHAGERCVHELVDELGLAQPLVSQHLRVLRNARLITGDRRGREIAYRLTDHHVAHIVLDAITHANEPDHPRHLPNPA